MPTYECSARAKKLSIRFVSVPSVCQDQRVHAAGPKIMDRRQRHIRGRELSGRRLHRRAARPSATEADVQLFWGEPLDVSGSRSNGSRLSRELGRDLPPLEFGLRIMTLLRDTSALAVGQQRLLELHERGDVLDDNLYTAPGKFGGGGAGTTWLVGSAEDVARSLRKYKDLGVTHFVLSDTPYLSEIKRQGDQLLPLLRV